MITMTIARKLSSAGSAVAIAALLAACQSAGPSLRSAPTPQGVEGQWISADGVAISTFSGGQFTTTATDTGNKLADGSYTMVDSRTAAITVVSLIRQTTTNVNCALASANQLNCTSSEGANFVLTRRTA
jgi:hypothetical protein